MTKRAAFECDPYGLFPTFAPSVASLRCGVAAAKDLPRRRGLLKRSTTRRHTLESATRPPENPAPDRTAGTSDWHAIRQVARTGFAFLVDFPPAAVMPPRGKEDRSRVPGLGSREPILRNSTPGATHFRPSRASELPDSALALNKNHSRQAVGPVFPVELNASLGGLGITLQKSLNDALVLDHRHLRMHQHRTRV